MGRGLSLPGIPSLLQPGPIDQSVSGFPSFSPCQTCLLPWSRPGPGSLCLPLSLAQAALSQCLALSELQSPHPHTENKTSPAKLTGPSQGHRKP